MSRARLTPGRLHRSALPLLRVAATLGVILSVVLVRQHILYRIGLPVESALCRVAGPFDCEAVEASGYSAWRGIPVASLSLFYFAVLGLLVSWLKPARLREDAPFLQGLLTALTLPALLFAWAMAMLSAWVIEYFCLGCTLLYGIVLLAALAPILIAPRTWIASLIRFPGEARRRLRQRPAAGAIRRPVFLLLVLLALAAFNFALPAWIVRSTGPRDALTAYFDQPRVELLPTRPGMTEGDPNAPLQLVVFTDFACPYCRRFEHDLRPLLNKRAGRYGLAYKHFPLSIECNPVMRDAAFDHPRACRLAQAAEALAELDLFGPWGAELYEVGEEDLYPALTRIAGEAGLSYGAWASRMTAARTRESIEADIREGLALGLRALPAVYVNGRYLHSLQPREVESILRAVESGAAP